MLNNSDDTRMMQLVPAIKAKIVSAILFSLICIGIFIWLLVKNNQSTYIKILLYIAIGFHLISTIYIMYEIVKNSLLTVSKDKENIWSTQKRTIIIQLVFLNLFASIFLIWQVINRNNLNYIIKNSNKKINNKYKTTK